VPFELEKVLIVGAGGFVGSAARYLLGGLVQSAAAVSTFPYGTLFVNASGCFVIGLLSQLFESQSAFGPNARAFLMVGVLGGYTTFSAFGSETVNMVRDGQPLAAGVNVGVQIVLGLLAVVLGRYVANLVWR